VLVAVVVAAGYVATMQVVGHIAPAFKSVPADYGLHAEVVSFQSLDGIELKGWWIPAQGTARATVILAHGNGGNRSSMLSRAAFLAANGYNAFPIDLRAHGESSGNHMTPGYLEALDILGAVEAAKRRGQAGPFVAFGHSYGARASLWAGARSNDIAAVIADAAFISIYATLKREADRVGSDPNASFGMRIGMRTANTLAQSSWARAFMETAYNFRTGVRLPSQFDDVMPAVSQIGKRPILLIVGGKDPIAPPEDSRRMYDAAQSPVKAILVIPGADHNSPFDAAPTLYKTKVLDFLNAAVSR
jgi:pimeloyl-ACP methyl ester carboxylesterase